MVLMCVVSLNKLIGVFLIKHSLLKQMSFQNASVEASLQLSGIV